MRRPKLPGCGKWLALFLLLGVAGFAVWLQRETQAMAEGARFYFRIDAATSLQKVLDELQGRKVVRNPSALRLWATLRRRPGTVLTGTYEIKPGMNADTLLAALRKPVRQMVRLPETNWSSRSANILEKKGVATAEEYIAWVKKPEAFKEFVEFPVPEGSLEGYLYPDTYDLPPLLGAQQVIRRQLKAFDTKVWKAFDQPKNLHRALTVASMVELEVARDDERPIVAGVIENRIAQGMRLQIDATVLFALQKWQRLTFKQIRETDSPYNTYTNSGLPPGPICSPSAKSVAAALNPAKHEFLYYVALPEGRHLFSRTYPEHLANIEKRKAALAEQP